MTEKTLPNFPVDDMTLNLIEHALSGSYMMNDDGEPVLVGADMSLDQLLDFLSGYDPELAVPYLDDDGNEIPDATLYPHPLYHPYDVIRALISEVRRLKVYEPLDGTI